MKRSPTMNKVMRLPPLGKEVSDPTGGFMESGDLMEEHEEQQSGIANE